MTYYSELPHSPCAVYSGMALTSKFDLVIGQRRDTIDGFCSGSEDRLTSTLGQPLDLAFAQIKQAAIDDASPWEEFCEENPSHASEAENEPKQKAK
jgi:hypothetical protein